KAHVVQPLLLATLFGNGQRRLSEVNPNDLTSHCRKAHGHITWASGDFQHAVLGGRTHDLHEPGHTLRIGNHRIRRVGCRLTCKLFAHNLVVFFGLWHVLFTPVLWSAELSYDYW